MLGKINFVNYERCYPSRLKKLFQADINYRTYDEFIPKMKNAVVGNIPPEIINLFKVGKGEKIKSFQNALSSITKYLRGCSAISEFANSQFKGILPKGIKAELTFVGKGAWGNVFKFSLKNNKDEKIMHDKALKVYHNLNVPLRSNLSRMQNNYAEANFWTFLKFAAGHKLDKTQFTKHYISDMKSGYTLTEFIDNDIIKTTAPLDLNILQLKYNDPGNTLINDKLYDGGGFVKCSDFIGDKMVLRYFKKLWFRNSEKELNKVIKDFKEKIANPKTPHRDKIQKALELFKHKQNIND